MTREPHVSGSVPSRTGTAPAQELAESNGTPAAPPDLEARIAAVAGRLGEHLAGLLSSLPEGALGPQRLATALGLDKVFTSRLLKALRGSDPIAIAYHVPGTEPLRRFCRAVRKKGAPAQQVRAAEQAIEAFQGFVRQEVGDRSALDALISAWLPEARQEFELRRKQAAYRAMSQLRGTSVRTNLATVILHPSADGVSIDVVWVFGLFGLQRLRPGAAIKLTSRRMVPEARGRRPLTLDGVPVDGPEGLRLDRFCQAPPAPLEVRAAGGRAGAPGETVHYLLGGDDFGARALVDLVLAEVNLAEIPRFVPAGAARKGYVFAEVGAPCRQLYFDVLVHDELYPGASPRLHLYDTALEGVADVNDPARDVDRLDMAESLQALGTGLGRLRVPEVPSYAELLRHVFLKTGWAGDRMRGWRARIEYPLYGSQVVAAFDAPQRPEPT